MKNTKTYTHECNNNAMLAVKSGSSVGQFSTTFCYENKGRRISALKVVATHTEPHMYISTCVSSYTGLMEASSFAGFTLYFLLSYTAEDVLENVCRT